MSDEDDEDLGPLTAITYIQSLLDDMEAHDDSTEYKNAKYLEVLHMAVLDLDERLKKLEKK